MENQNNFTPPTIEQINSFLDERGLDIDGEQFYFYYAARGWQMGNGVTMADWQAALYCWAIQQRAWARAGSTMMRGRYDDYY